MLDVIGMVKSLADAATAAEKKATQHEALNNSPEMQKAMVLDLMQQEIDKHRQNIADEDLEAYRRAVAGVSPE